MRTKWLAPILVVGIAVAVAGCVPSAESAAPATTGGVIAAFNQDRAANGVAGLTEDAQLARVAQNWAEHLAVTGQPEHQDLGTLQGNPYMSAWRALGEILFVGPSTSTSSDMENAWMGSPFHRSIILDPNMNYVGIGLAQDNAGQVWVVADFGSR